MEGTQLLGRLLFCLGARQPEPYRKQRTCDYHTFNGGVMLPRLAGPTHVSRASTGLKPQQTKK